MIRAGRFARRYGDGHKLIGLVEQPSEFLQSSIVDFQMSKLDNVAEHFEPEIALVGFFFNRSQF